MTDRILKKVKLVDDMKTESYEQRSIDDYGKDMLRKMGWQENEKINGKLPVKVVEFKPRPSGLGLGAVSLNEKSLVKYSTEKKKNYFGTKIKIIQGKHKGLKGIIVDEIENLELYMKNNKYINVELKINKQIEKINSEFIKIRGKHDKEEKIKKLKLEKVNINKLTWVTSNIIVKIINIDKGIYYNTKAYIEDVLDSYTFSLITKDKIMHTDYTENDIQTVMPSVNDNLIILIGSNKGELAKLIERDKKNNRITVQLLSDLSIHYYTQDECCLIK